MLFDKKYPAIVLTQAHMLAFHYMQEGLRFILADEMDRILHMTIDSSRGSDDGYGYKYLSNEYDISLLLKNGEILTVAVRIQVHFRNVEWTISLGGEHRILFAFKTKEKGGRIEFTFIIDVTNGKFLSCHINHFYPNGKWEVYENSTTPNGASLQDARKLFLEE